jgi:hypothetical protein
LADPNGTTADATTFASPKVAKRRVKNLSASSGTVHSSFRKRFPVRYRTMATKATWQCSKKPRRVAKRFIAAHEWRSIEL